MAPYDGSTGFVDPGATSLYFAFHEAPRRAITRGLTGVDSGRLFGRVLCRPCYRWIGGIRAVGLPQRRR